ncbi:hypothetical protein WG66_008444 [Moniliophthora roreri]|nr:hypothetical protein WG66_008444 [Moniliophthora roreri]
MAYPAIYPSERRFPRRVVVDDTDARVKYDGGSWLLDGGSFDDTGSLGAPYNRSMHGTNQNGSSLSFTFEVWGAKDTRKISRNSTNVDDDLTKLPGWKCFVDGNEIPRINYLTNIEQITNNLLCELSGLSAGPHTVTVNVTIDDPNTQTFWFDKLEYLPMEDVKLDGEVIRIDSSDSSIRYDNGTGNWIERPAATPISNSTDVPGESLSFRFNGTSVSLFGFIAGSISRRQASNAVYSIDGSPDTLFEIPGSKPLQTNSSVLLSRYNELLFTSRDLEPGTHDMKITFTGVRTGGDPLQWLTVDYFMVKASAGTLDADSGQGSPAPLPAESGSRKSRIGPIVGGTIGGVAGVLLLALGVFLILKRRKTPPGDKEAKIEGGFDSSPVSADVNPNERFIRSRSPGLISSNAGSTMFSEPEGFVVYPSTENPPANLPAPARAFVERHHQDSGVRYSQPQDGMEMPVIDVPPGYTVH